MKKLLLAMLLLMFTGALKAEGVFELSNADTQDKGSFTEKVIDGKIKWNVFYEIRKSDYVGAEDYLRQIGLFLKDYPGCTISVKSYADKGTGNAKLNIMYSRLRNEKAVAALVAAGVDRKLIQASYYGDTVQPFAENDKNRLTIIEASGLKVVNEKKETEPATTKTEVTTPVEKTPVIETTPVVEEKTVVETTPVVEEKTPITEEQHAVATVPDDSSSVEENTTKKKDWHAFFTPRHKDADKYKGRWFIGANVGAQTYIGDHNRQTKFKDIATTLITPSADIYAGYWITRFFGARIDIAGFNIKGLTYKKDSEAYGLKNYYYTPEKYVCRTGETLDRQRFNYIDTHFDLLFNLMQVTKNGNEVFDLIPYAGFGWAVAWSPYRHSDTTNGRAWDFGLIFGWHFAPHWSLNLDARGILVPDAFDGDGHYNGNTGKDRNNKYEGIPSLNLGLSYTF